MSLKEVLYKLGHGAEARFDAFKLGFRERLGLIKPIHIQPYITFSNGKEVHLRGRVLENRNILAQDDDEIWHSLLNTYKRFNSNEIAGARLRATIHDQAHEFISDDDGYFQHVIPLREPLDEVNLWHHVHLDLVDAPVAFDPPVSAKASIMTAPASATFGIISDIDDTILKTNATSLLKSAYLTFLNNARSRLPFEGVAAFYDALGEGGTGSDYNPLFYVSSSPWNLYDLLTDFMELNDIPKGAIYLSDWGFTKNKLFTSSHHEHKLSAIRNILEKFPSLPFVLLGDSGQKDPEIYAEIVKEHPGRIQCIYIRDVTLDERDLEVKKISEGLAGSKVEMVFVENSAAASEHALARNYIRPAAVPKIEQARKKDDPEVAKAEKVVEKAIETGKLG